MPLFGPSPKKIFRKAIEKYETGDYEGASKLFKEYLKKKAEDHVAWYLLAACNLALDKYDVALYSIDKAIDLNPEDADYWFVKAHLFMVMKNYEIALPLYVKALSLDPNNGNIVKDIGLCLCLLKRYEDAIPYLRRGLMMTGDEDLRELLEICEEKKGTKEDVSTGSIPQEEG